MSREAAMTTETREHAATVVVRPWDLWDRPFIYTTENLDTFLLFLTDEESRAYEISSLTPYSMTLLLSGPESSSVLFTSGNLRSSQAERHKLHEAVECFPKAMPRFVRKKLAAHVRWFFALKKLQP